MSKCHPNKKKIRRRLQNEHKKEVSGLHRLLLSKNERIRFAEDQVEGLKERVENFRVALREVGNNHELKYEIAPTRDGTLISTGRVNARDLEFKIAGQTKNDVERLLVGKLAKALIENGLVRIEEVEPRDYEDMQRGTVTYKARIDVIPWYKIVKPEIVFLDRDTSRMIMREGERP